MNKKIIISIIVVALVVFAGAVMLHAHSNQSSLSTTSSSTNSINTTTATTTSSDTTTPGEFTMAQVASHNTQESCYTAINGSVYDLTSWINQHPGGPDKILSLCGTDGTAAFTTQHGGQRRPERELATFKIGTLKQ